MNKRKWKIYTNWRRFLFGFNWYFSEKYGLDIQVFFGPIRWSYDIPVQNLATSCDKTCDKGETT